MARREQIPARPFADFLNRKLAEYEAGHDRSGNVTRRNVTAVTPLAPIEQLAADLGWGTGHAGARRLYRYRHMLADTSVNGRKGEYPSDTFNRTVVEDALDHIGVPFEDLYPELATDVALEPDAYCEHCHETVTPIDGVCPWCDRPASDVADRERLFCKREDRMVFPANDGSCWRCGGRLSKGTPYVACECGCGELVARFDRHGRGPVLYVRGHNPRSLERSRTLRAGPFAEYLREQVATVDPLAAVATKHHLKREHLVALLQGTETEVDRDVVRTALWKARRYAQPPGAPMRPGPSIPELYPDDALSRTCPGCGNGKSAHAELCKQCRIKRDREQRRARRQSSSLVSEAVIVEGWRLHSVEGLTVAETARRLHSRTGCRSADALRLRLADAFRKRGWTRAPDRVAA